MNACSKLTPKGRKKLPIPKQLLEKIGMLLLVTIAEPKRAMPTKQITALVMRIFIWTETWLIQQ
jgi:hypothetical protein